MQILNNLKVPIRAVDAKRHTRNPETYGVFRGFLTPESGDDPARLARRFLLANDADLGAVFTQGPAFAQPGPGRLELGRQVRTPSGYHVRFCQVHEGVPVLGAGASVHMTGRRQVYMAVNDLTRDIPAYGVDEAKRAGLPEREAIRKAVQAVDGRGRLRGSPAARLVIYRLGDRRYLAWQVCVGLSAIMPVETEMDRAAAWLVYVDVKDGDVLAKINALARARGRAQVFCPNPVVTLRDTNLSADARFPWYAYRFVELQRLRGSGYLSGRYVSTRLTPRPRAFSSSNEFYFGSQDPGFEEVMAYYWIDQISSYLRSLGFRNVMQSPLPVNARGTEGDQSWYDPLSRELNFGLGGVNDAEDADIILHEFGHAFLDALVPSWGHAWYDAPVRAMGEGVGDFMACSFLASVNGSFQPEVVGDWDARGYLPPATHLRRVDGSKTLDNVVGRGTITGLTAHTLTDANAHWTPGALRGLAVTPNVESGGAPAYFSITDNTPTTIEVEVPSWDNLLERGQVGDRYAGEEHQDGEFWAAVLWDIYLALGGSSTSSADRGEAASKSLKLVLAAHKYLDDPDRETIQYQDGADALLDADRFVWGDPTDVGPHDELLRGVLQKRKLIT